MEVKHPVLQPRLPPTAKQERAKCTTSVAEQICLVKQNTIVEESSYGLTAKWKNTMKTVFLANQATHGRKWK
jgi:hypothetical protein